MKADLHVIGIKQIGTQITIRMIFLCINQRWDQNCRFDRYATFEKPSCPKIMSRSFLSNENYVLIEINFAFFKNIGLSKRKNAKMLLPENFLINWRYNSPSSEYEQTMVASENFFVCTTGHLGQKGPKRNILYASFWKKLLIFQKFSWKFSLNKWFQLFAKSFYLNVNQSDCRLHFCQVYSKNDRNFILIYEKLRILRKQLKLG